MPLLRAFALVFVLLAGCATRNVVPGLAVGATASDSGDLSATVTVSPEGLICTVLDLLNLDDLCRPGASETKPAPVGGIPTTRLFTPGNPESLRGSVLAGPMRSTPSLNGPIAPSRHYPGV